MQVMLRVFGSAACLALLLATTAAAALTPAEEGRRVFLRENCYGCHGGRAGGGMGPSFRGDRPDGDDVRDVLEDGKDEGMPAYPRLTREDARNLGAYFRTLRTPREPTFTHWWEPVPTQ